MPRVPRGGCGTSAAAADIPWAKVGENSDAVASGVFTDFDMDSASGWSFFTNDPATFENGANAGGLHGVSALVSGVYEILWTLGFSVNAAIAHGTKEAGMFVRDAITSSISDWDMHQTGTNLGALFSGIDAANQYFDLYLLSLSNIPDGIAPANIPGFTTWAMSGQQDSGHNATAYPAIYVKRIAAALPGGIS